MLTQLLENNRRWSERVNALEPDFFPSLARQQSPAYLWIGCSDSRVPANQICGLLPGEIFVHRNVANVVVHSDLNFLSVLQFAVDHLHVKHIIVCGHHGCGGVRAAWEDQSLGLADNWLRHVQDVRHKHIGRLAKLPPALCQVDHLCKLNAIEQAANVCQTTVVRDAWRRGQKVAVHAWVYRLTDGLVEDLEFSVEGEDGLAPELERALARLDRLEEG